MLNTSISCALQARSKSSQTALLWPSSSAQQKCNLSTAAATARHSLPDPFRDIGFDGLVALGRKRCPFCRDEVLAKNFALYQNHQLPQNLTDSTADEQSASKPSCRGRRHQRVKISAPPTSREEDTPENMEALWMASK